MDNSKHQNHDELDSSQQLNGMELNTIPKQENGILLIIKSSKSTRVSVTNHIGITIKSMFIQGLFIQHLHRGVSTVVNIQPSLPVSLQGDILRYFYRGISTFMSLQSFVLTFLRNGFL